MVADILDFTSESKQIQKRTIQKTIDYERESLNSDDQQFHQYQQKEQQFLNSYHQTQKKTTTYGIRNL
jgi:hypothetical protein